MNEDIVVPLGSLFILAVLMPLAIGYTRWFLRKPPKNPDPSAAELLAPRLERLEQAVEAIAIEVERIAEGQRFVTKLMVDRPAQLVNGALPPAESAAIADPRSRPKA